MGTSRRWPGPSGGPWRPVNGRLTRLLRELEARPGSVVVLPPGADDGTGPANVGDAGEELVTCPGSVAIPPPRAGGGTGPADVGDAGSVLVVGLSPDEVARLGQSYRNALAVELRAMPDCFGLRSAVEQSGRRLVDILEAIDLHGLAWFRPFESVTAEERLDEFVARFADQVAHSVGLTVDAVVRQAAADTARYLLDRSPALRHAVETGDGDAVGIDDELFCMIYRLFFAYVVTRFLQSVIAAKITLMVPVLPAVDPAGHIANWIAEKIVSIIPTPCQGKDKHGVGPSLADLGRSLVEKAVERALGIPTDGQS